MSLFVSSHYKNSPNDLQLLSDAPAHGLFVLCGPLDQAQGGVPDILCAVQICFEGDISSQVYEASVKRGIRPSGDLIPWTVSEQFQDSSFAQLNGIRVVRIATHPHAQKKGYGTRALKLLKRYFQGELVDIDSKELTDELEEYKSQNPDGKASSKIKPRKSLKPILQKLEQRRPIKIHWMGTSFGLTPQLYGFWSKNDFYPIYLRQTPNALTGEHTCIMLQFLNTDEFEVKETGHKQSAQFGF